MRAKQESVATEIPPEMKAVIDKYAESIKSTLGSDQELQLWEAYQSDPACKNTPLDLQEYIRWALDTFEHEEGTEAETAAEQSRREPVARRNGYAAYYFSTTKPLSPEKAAQTGEETHLVEYYRVKDPTGEFVTVFRNQQGVVLTPEDAIDLVAGKRIESSRTFQKSGTNETFSVPVYLGAMTVDVQGDNSTLKVGQMDMLVSQQGDFYAARFRTKDESTGKYQSWRLYSSMMRGQMILGLDQLFDLGIFGATEHEGVKLRLTGEMLKGKEDRLIAKVDFEWPKRSVSTAKPSASMAKPASASKAPARVKSSPSSASSHEENEEAGIGF